MDNPKTISFNYGRRFGVEIELNASDRRDFKKNPLKKDEQPAGIEYVANVLMKVIQSPVEIKKHHHTHNNNSWVLKPDSSCGIEICSEVTRGYYGVKRICQVIQAFSDDPEIKLDERCSLHLHMDVSDTTLSQLGTALAWWIKGEPVFLDAMTPNRKRNRYCQSVGMSDYFDVDTKFDPDKVIKKLGIQKYFSINTYHMNQKKRSTIEFRIMGAEGCRDAFLAKNWIRLLIHFFEMGRNAPPPVPYEKGNPKSGYCWLDPIDVFDFLGFNGEYELSKGMLQTRNWFLARLYFHTLNTGLPCIWSDQARQVAFDQVKSLAKKFNYTTADLCSFLHPEDVKKSLFLDNI